MNSTTTGLELAAEILGGQALVLIKSRYEDGHLSQRLRYHITSHTISMRKRFIAIARAIGLGERAIAVGYIAVSFHDSVQGWHAVEKDNGVIIRHFHSGVNEMMSLVEMVDAVSAPTSPIVFTPEEYGVAGSGILATIPAWSTMLGTVIQPFLTPCSHPVARAVALADLGAAGMDPECFVRDWKTLFAEEQLDIMAALANAKRASDIDGSTQDSYRARYTSWIGSQAGFAKGRRALLNHELEGLADTDAREHVHALFNHFDESIELAEAATKLAKTQDFVPLMRQILPGAFPGEGR